MAKQKDEKNLTGADVTVETKQEKQELPQGDLVQVSAVHSTINKANSAGSTLTEAEMKRDVEAAKRALQAKETKSISIPKQMAPYTGETMVSCINGACIRVPVDGNSYDIPAPYYELIMNSLKTIHAGDVRSEYGFGDKVDDAPLQK